MTPSLPAISLLIAFACSGCVTSYDLLMDAHREPVVHFVRSRASAEHRVHEKIIVPPPAAMSLGRAEELTARLEAALLERGLTLISSIESAELQLPGEADSAAELELEISEGLQVAERIEAAEVVVKIVKFEWAAPRSSCFFILAAEDDEYLTEVDAESFGYARDPKFALKSEVLSIDGKVIDVESGEILDTFTITSGANWHLDTVYSATLEEEREQKLRVVEESFHYERGAWIPAAKQAAFDEAMDILAASLLGRRP